MPLRDEILEQPSILERVLLENQRPTVAAREILERADTAHVLIAADAHALPLSTVS